MKPRLLYLTPVMPATSGNGLAMRAGAILEALAAHYAVTLLVVPQYPPLEPTVPEYFARLCQAAIVRRPAIASRGGAWDRLRAITGALRRPTPALVLGELSNERFEVVHVFRLLMMPFARQLLRDTACSPAVHLDLDDLEPQTHRRIAALCRANGDDGQAAIEDAAARRYEALEASAFEQCDRIYVCSELDRDLLAKRTVASIAILPNAVRSPDMIPPRRRSEPFTFLFVGNMAYYPNEDAVRYLAGEIIPRLRALTSQPFRVDIVGAGAGERLTTLRLPELRFVGAVASVASSYAGAAAVAVPMRAGGGTRIKILEAFSYQRPVVTTRIGIEGIDVCDGTEVLTADTAEAFATSCVRLMDDWALGDRLAERAHATLLRSYSFAALKRTIAAPIGARSQSAAQSTGKSPLAR